MLGNILLILISILLCGVPVLCVIEAGEVLIMTGNGWFQIFLYFVAVLLVTKPMGVFLYRVFEKKGTFLDFVLRPIERLIYRATGVDEQKEMGWKEYGVAMLLFSGVSLVLLYVIERMQVWLPWNPQKLANVAPDLAWNTAVSFTTNTNWQSYSGESTMSYLTQMAGLAYHNFASAAVGIALAIALIRGVSRRESKTIGNFWVDTTRAFLWVLLPVSLVVALFFVSQGMIQNLRPYTTATVVEPQVVETKNRRWHGEKGYGGDAGDRAGAGGFARSDQDVRHEWGRIFRGKQRASV